MTDICMLLDKKRIIVRKRNLYIFATYDSCEKRNISIEFFSTTKKNCLTILFLMIIINLIIIFFFCINYQIYK